VCAVADGQSKNPARSEGEANHSDARMRFVTQAPGQSGVKEEQLDDGGARGGIGCNCTFKRCDFKALKSPCAFPFPLPPGLHARETPAFVGGNAYPSTLSC
jgi:hypothetical protein